MGKTSDAQDVKGNNYEDKNPGLCKVLGKVNQLTIQSLYSLSYSFTLLPGIQTYKLK
jgi:hypothetical protein